MKEKSVFNILYDPTENAAVLLVGSTPLTVIYGSDYVNGVLKMEANEIAEFCDKCVRRGAVKFPEDYKQLPSPICDQKIRDVVSECVGLLAAARKAARDFPGTLEPSDFYAEAASRGKLTEVDIALKTIVDEFSCGGEFTQDYRPVDAQTLFEQALLDNEWIVPVSLDQARVDLGITERRGPSIGI